MKAGRRAVESPTTPPDRMREHAEQAIRNGRHTLGHILLPRWRSVRVQTTVIAAGVVAITLILAAYLLIATLRSQLRSTSDAASRSLVSTLAERAADGALPPVIGVGDGSMAQVVNSDGRVLAASPNLGDAGPVSTAELRSRCRLLVLTGVPDDADVETYRVWARTARTGSGEVRIFAGSSPEQSSEAVRALVSGLLVGVPAVLAVLAASVWSLTARAMRPVEQIRTQVAEISGSALDRRVPVPASDDEIERLARTMTDMLERLDHSAQRQREFVADASHELQSPLAAFRAQLEVAATHVDDTDWPALVGDLLADSDRMERLVRDLLFLAREDSGAVSGAGTPVDLDIVMLEEISRLRPRTGVVVDPSGVCPAPVWGHPEDLSRMVRNVLENAADHATERVFVALTVVRSSSESPLAHSARLTITDDGPGVPADMRGRVFERFVRAEPDRRRRAFGGTGLGLPIARAIARRHGGEASLTSDDRGTTVSITLPSA
ncbi:MAG: ATP-binding protein [Nocardioides sp.]